MATSGPELRNFSIIGCNLALFRCKKYPEIKGLPSPNRGLIYSLEAANRALEPHPT
jgi:hypothetical protein